MGKQQVVRRGIEPGRIGAWYRRSCAQRAVEGRDGLRRWWPRALGSFSSVSAAEPSRSPAVRRGPRHVRTSARVFPDVSHHRPHLRRRRRSFSSRIYLKTARQRISNMTCASQKKARRA